MSRKNTYECNCCGVEEDLVGPYLAVDDDRMDEKGAVVKTAHRDPELPAQESSNRT